MDKTSPKILIVDDEPNNHHVYNRILEPLPLDIVSVMSGQKALEVAPQHDFFLILMDVQMPEMDGFEAASLLLDHPKTSHIPIIFITAIAKDEVFEFKGYQSGAVDYLIKPINENILLSKIKIFLELHKNKKQLENSLSEITQLNENLKNEIEERKRIEQELRFSEERFKCLSDASIEGIVLSDNGKIVDVNSSLASMFGYSIDELKGMMSIDLVCPEDREETQEKILSGYEKAYEIKGLRKDGSRFPLGVHGRMINYHDRQLRITAVRDRTEQKKVEQERLRSKKLEATAILAGGIAHDFNNLLSVIIGYLDMAIEDLGPCHELTKLLGTALNSSKKLHELANKFITFSSGGSPYKKKSSIIAVLNQSISTFISQENCQVKLSLTDKLWQVEIDTTQISNIFKILLQNAKDAVEGRQNQEIQISAKNVSAVSKEKIASDVDIDKRFIHICISDKGRGISEDLMQKIFDPYFSTKDRGAQKGMGLGLAVAHSIIKQHDGFLVINSKEGVGTSVHIYLPATE